MASMCQPGVNGLPGWIVVHADSMNLRKLIFGAALTSSWSDRCFRRIAAAMSAALVESASFRSRLDERRMVPEIFRKYFRNRVLRWGGSQDSNAPPEADTPRGLSHLANPRHFQYANCSWVSKLSPLAWSLLWSIAKCRVVRCSGAALARFTSAGERSTLLRYVPLFVVRVHALHLCCTSPISPPACPLLLS